MKTFINETLYQIHNDTRNLYCGPRFFSFEHKSGMGCTFDVRHRVGSGVTFRTACRLLKSLRQSYPKTEFSIHKVTTKVEILSR